MEIVKIRRYRTSTDFNVNVPSKFMKEYFEGINQFFVSVIDNKLVYEPVIKPGDKHD